MAKILLATLALQLLFLSSSFAQPGPSESSAGVVQQPPATASLKQATQQQQTPSASAALRTALTRDRDSKVRRNAALSLAKMNVGDQTTIKAFIRQLNDADPAVRQASYDALKRIGKPSIPSLVAALKHRRPLVRRTAAQLLGELKPTNTPTPAASAAQRGENSSSKSSAGTAKVPPKT
jgi:HEAT repeat protein